MTCVVGVIGAVVTGASVVTGDVVTGGVVVVGGGIVVRDRRLRGDGHVVLVVGVTAAQGEEQHEADGPEREHHAGDDPGRGDELARPCVCPASGGSSRPHGPRAPGR